MKTKTLVTTIALAGALVASTSVAKANAFLELASGGVTASETTSVYPTTLTANVGVWSGAAETGNENSGPLVIDVGISGTGGTGKHAAPLWIIYSTSNPGQTLGVWGLSTGVEGHNYVVSDWLYASSTLQTGIPAGLPFGSQIGMTPSATYSTSGVVAGLNYYTEVFEILPPAKGKSTLSIDSTFTLPDGGSTVALLGSLMAGLAGLRSKFGKRA
jgi:hypothetical protein